MVGYTSPAFLRKLNSTPNRESEKAASDYAVIQKVTVFCPEATL